MTGGGQVEMDYSVIIPVWDTPADYLGKAIRSVATNACDWEILLADDGSSEETVRKLKEIREEQDRVSLIFCPHAGVSAARNRGVAQARGTYVLFLDADDELVPGVLDAMLPVLRKEQPDLLLGQIARRAGKPAEDVPAEACVDLSGEKQRLRNYYLAFRDGTFRQEDKWLNRAPHGRIVRRELAQRVPMPEELRFGEDVIWNFRLLNGAGRVLFLPRQVYCYRENAFSATQHYRENFPEELKKLLAMYREEVASWPEEDRGLLAVAEMEYFTILMRLYVLAAEPEKRRSHYREVMGDPFWREAFREVRLRDCHGRYRLTAALGKARCHRLLYLTFAAHRLGKGK